MYLFQYCWKSVATEDEMLNPQISLRIVVYFITSCIVTRSIPHILKKKKNTDTKTYKNSNKTAFSGLKKKQLIKSHQM